MSLRLKFAWNPLINSALAQFRRPRSEDLKQHLSFPYQIQHQQYSKTIRLDPTSMSPTTGTSITLPNATQHDLTNTSTGLNYRVQISWPLNWDRTKQIRNSKIPVIYILDGNALFLTATEILWRSASNSFYHGGGIIVAIGYQNIPTETGSLFSSQRNTDLTLNEHEVHAGLGGADPFLEFIGREVRPLVRREFEDVSIGEEAIFGHSFGGLCVLHALFSKRGGAFDAYFAASPSVWWDPAIVEEAEKFCSAESEDTKCSLQISYGALEAKPKKTNGESDVGFEEREKRCTERKMGDNAAAMEKKLRSSGRLTNVSIIEFEGEDHSTVATSALLGALSTFFDH